MKVIITGVSGLLGWNFAKFLNNLNVEVVGTYNTNKPDVNFKVCNVRLVDFNQCIDLLKTETPDYVINCVALRDTNCCEIYKEESRVVNVYIPQILASACNVCNVKLIHLSSDLVFDGRNPEYTEDSEPSPCNVYGSQKALSELQVLSINSKFLIFRLPLMYGNPSPYHNSFLQDIINRISNGNTVNLFENEIRTPVSVTDVIEGIWKLKVCKGILHLGGLENISRFDFGRLVCDIGNYNLQLLQPVWNTNANRPKNLIFSSDKAISLGYSPKTIIENLSTILK